jgi:hypothetical protein
MKALNSLILTSAALIGTQAMAAENPAVVLVHGLQQKMVAATPVRLELTLNTGHTPFLTDVSGLVSAIEQAAK